MTSRSISANRAAGTLFLLAALITAVLFSSGVGSAHASVVSSKPVTGMTSAEVKRYWTSARMEEAVPAVPDASQAVAPSALPEVASGKSEVIPAQTDRSVLSRSNLVLDPESLPYRLHGKLFFQGWTRELGWRDYVCSGTVVNSRSKRVVITAGHCVFESRWSRAVVFVPAYQDGLAPFGEFAATRTAAPTLWTRNEWSRPQFALSYDIGAVVLGGPVPIQTVLGGGRGIAFGIDRRRTYTAFGYPAEATSTHPEYDGGDLVSCTSAWGGADRFSYKPFPGWLTCDLSRGASGGGWIFGSGILNSVNSYGRGDDWQRMYGPYFGRVARKLYESVKNG